MIRERKNNSLTSINILAPLVLFCFFAISAILVILLGAKVYESTIKGSEKNYTAGTAVAYITEKIHRADSKDAVSVGSFDGIPALIISGTNSEEGKADSDTSETNSSADNNAEMAGNKRDTETTYIYACNGSLCELTALPDSGASAGDGTPILPVSAFSVSSDNGHIITFSCTDEDGNTASGKAAVRSGEVG